MQVKNLPFFLFTLLIIHSFTYGQDVNRNDTASSNTLIFSNTEHAVPDSTLWRDTAKIQYSWAKKPFFPDSAMVNDTTKIPYLSAKGTSFTDSLKEVLKNNLSTLTKRDDTADVSCSNFFILRQTASYSKSNRPQSPFDWFFAVLFLFLVTLAVIRLRNPDLFLPLQHIWSKRKQKDAFPKTGNLSRNFGVLLLILCSWTGFSMAFAEVLSFFHFPFLFDPLFSAFAVLFAYSFAKYLLEKMTAWLFQSNSVASKRILMAVHTNFIWILAAIPLIVVNHYVANHFLCWIICFIFCMNLLHKLLFTWIIFSRKLHPLNILLYLCTIEILPLLLGIKYIINYCS